LVAIAVTVQADELLAGTAPALAAVDGFSAAYLVGAGILLFGAILTASLLRNSSGKTTTESVVGDPASA
jgi:hypothetical protein